MRPARSTKAIKPVDRDSHKHDLAPALQELGFTDHEARAYLALLRSHPATAYEVAKIAGLPRSNVYSVLRALETKSAIQPVTENPVRYVPRDPEQFFGQIQKRVSALCSDVVPQIRRQSRSDENVYVWVFRGEQEVRGKLFELIDAAREHVWIKAPAHLIEPVQDRLIRAARRGVDVKLIAFGAESHRLAAHQRITVFPHEGDGVPHGAADVLFTITVDFNGVMIVSHADRIIGSYARNHSIVYVIQTLMLHEIYYAEIYAEFGDALDARFGKRLAKLRRQYRPRGMERYVLEGK